MNFVPSLCLRLSCIVSILVGVSGLEAQDNPAPAGAQTVSANESDKVDKEGWKPLLKGSDLSGWIATNFGGEGKVELNNGQLILGFGEPLTGIHYRGKDFPKDNYEMRWEAKRTQGQDFFAGITFPIGDEYCSFIAGGWGGSLTGISCIDGNDASENETTGAEDFKNGQWYRFRIRVKPETLVVWLDDREIISIDREGKRFSLRVEVEASRPLGYCNFNCEAMVRGWEYRSLDEPSPAKKPSPAEASRKEAEAEPIFLRIKKDVQDEPLSLQTSVSRYRISTGSYAGAVIDLIGAVHVGESSYYAELNRRFKNYDALLYELVADPNVRLAEMKKDRGVYNPLSAMQVGMKDTLKLSFQLDEVNYQAKNFIHADMTPEEFAEDMRKRNDGFLSMAARLLGSSIAASGTPEMAGADARMLAALMAKDREMALRRVMAEQFENMDIQLAGLADKHGKSTLVTERNRKAMEVLDRRLKKGERQIGIFYGAAHLKDMDHRLVEDFLATRGEVEWLDAWRLR